MKENGGLGGSGDGIVAASLTQNGWVKFNNGLILQWGKAVGTNVSVVNFPITFTSTQYVGYLTRTASGNSGNNTVIVRNITTTQLYGEFAYGGSDKGVYWLVIGK